MVVVMAWLSTTGCVVLWDKHTEKTKSAQWWGSLATNKVLKVRQDLLIGDKLVLKNIVGLIKGKRALITPDIVARNPGDWPDMRILKTGTTIECKRLFIVERINWSRYKVLALVRDGDHKGQTVDIGRLVGFPTRPGSLDHFEFFVSATVEEQFRK